MEYLKKSDQYDKEFVNENMMGPNSMIILEELLNQVPLKQNMRVLDLGCGNALTSIFLAKEYGVKVFAVDLWISASDNLKRIEQMSLEHLIIPIHADANELPFADAYFDAVISVDAYHYFGNNDAYFQEKLRPLLKKEALVALAFPGMKYEVHEAIPKEMKPFWPEDALSTWHSMDWWRQKFQNNLKEFEINEMKCFKTAWDHWLSTDNPYAIEDKEMIAADGGRFMNLISITGKLKDF